jgi:hypothetical protein
VTQPDLDATARAIIDANLYMALGTADQDGRPWVSPVYFASSEFREYFWVSSPDATHSRNLAGRPEVGIVSFDSQVPIGGAQAVYMTASADEVTGSERERGIGVFHGGRRSMGPAHGCWPTCSRLHRFASIGRRRPRITSSVRTTNVCRSAPR